MMRAGRRVAAGFRRLPPALQKFPIALAFAAIALVFSVALPAFAVEPAAELQDLRQQSIAAAESAQQDERTLFNAQHDVALLERDAAGAERDLKETRGEQAQLLAALARLARNPPQDFGIAPEAPLDRLRTGLLVKAAPAALERDAQALIGEYDRLAALKRDVAKREAEIAVQRANVQKDYAGLAELIARREAAQQKLSPDANAARLGAVGEKAADLRGLIKAVDTGQTAKKATEEPGRPPRLRVFDAAAAPMLHPPVTGAIARRFGPGEESERPSNGLEFSAMPGAVVVAPFDGRVVYAGRFRQQGPILIIAHAGGYHSVLAGLDRIEARPGEWVLAGEPVGAMPDTPPAGSGTVLTYELRRDGEPVDPFPSLIDSGEGDSGKMGRDGASDSRVR